MEVGPGLVLLPRDVALTLVEVAINRIVDLPAPLLDPAGTRLDHRLEIADDESPAATQDSEGLAYRTSHVRDVDKRHV